MPILKIIHTPRVISKEKSHSKFNPRISHIRADLSIVSSDSDYTRLATKIRENGLFVMGIGMQHTPEAFVKACDRFIYTEILISEESSQKDKTMDLSILKKLDKQKMIEAIPLMRQAFEMAEGDDGWAHLGAVGNYLRD